MIPENRTPTHPGEMLVEEFLKPAGTSQSEFARKLGIPLQRVNEIATGKRGVTADTAWRFAAALGTSPQFWMNLQTTYDLFVARPKDLGRRRVAGAGLRSAASRITNRATRHARQGVSRTNVAANRKGR